MKCQVHQFLAMEGAVTLLTGGVGVDSQYAESVLGKNITFRQATLFGGSPRLAPAAPVINKYKHLFKFESLSGLQLKN